MQQSLLLRNVSVFDGSHDTLSGPMDVLIQDGRFVRLSKAPAEIEAETVLDLSGHYITPGLIDAHFHAYASDLDFARLEQLPDTLHALKGSSLLTAALKRGFTTVRDVGGADYGLWRGIEDGLFPGPRLFYGGRALSQTGGHGDTRLPSMEPCGCGSVGRLARVVDGVDNLRQAAREELRRGASHIKVFVSGGISSPSDPIGSLQYSMAELEAVVDEADRRGCYVVAHAYTPEAIARAVRAGIRSIEHGNLITPEVAELVKSHGAFVNPTLVTYDALARFGAQNGAPASLLEKLTDVKDQGIEAVRLCRQIGVKLGFGTDLLGNLHTHQREELSLRTQVDTPFQVLQSATSVNARLIGMEDKLGTIMEGAFADFLVLNSDPLASVDALVSGESIQAVYKGGSRIDR